ncbi:MAG TPA: ABC transporter permease [Chitinophagaceae bacterium]|nr:ABC transporter permease [Chitinophagaceae bacterium]
MFKTNLKIAWRNLIKDRKFTLLNVLGLSAGLACTLMIYLWVSDELSYDKFFKDDNQVYQLMEKNKIGGEWRVSDESSGLLSKTVLAQVPDVEYAAPLAPPSWFQKFTLSVNNNNIKAEGQYAGKDYFNIFSFKLLSGVAGKVLADKSSVVISDELAKKLFGATENIIGKAIRFQQQQDFFVSGVFEKTPRNSSQQFDFVMSFDYYKDIQPWVYQWGNLGPHNFIKLKKGISADAVNKKIENIITASTGDTTRKVFAEKFSDVYLKNSFDHGVKTESRMIYVKLFSLIAIVILVIACINFMNLSTAKAARRMKEVGIKKVVGAARIQLIFQFLCESLLLTVVAMIAAVVLTLFLLPQFNQLTGKQIVLHFDAGIITAFALITLVTGLLAGSYPAFYLSKFKPLAILKGKLNSSLAELISRKGLVIFQFTLSAMLIVAVLVIYNQVQFIQSTSAGYDKDNVVRFDAEGKLNGKESDFITELKKIPGVVNASFTFNNMVGRNYGNYGISWDGKNPNEDVYFEGFGGGFDFIETMGMQMQSGRSFSKNYGDEDSKIILNEAAVKIMGLKDPVGKTIKLFDKPRQVIGVVKDFHFESLHETVKPSYMTLLHDAPNPWIKIMVRIKAGHEKETMATIQNLYQNYNPGFPFTFNFLDELYQKQYETEARVSVLSKYFAGLAILISCLGLFGLAAFTAQKRQKEIGIRKVIGASVSGIIIMLSKDFIKLVLVSLLIAFPVAWWLMSKWLQGFAYRVNLGYGVFVFAALFIVVITLATISWQSIKAATANPVKAIKAE